MALLGREFIAVPDDRKRQIVYRWGDNSVRKGSRAIVNADEVALFVNTGQVVGTMGPGRHQIDAQEMPFLGAIIDWATAGNAYRAELFFVATREFPGFTFGGRIDDVQDPQTGVIVTLRVFGDYSLRVLDPALLITNLVGTMDITDNEEIAGWVSDQLLEVMRSHVSVQITSNDWPVLGLSAYTPEIEKTVIAAGNEQLVDYGLAIVRMGNFDVNLLDSDEVHLKALARDTAYTRLAGGFNQYPSGAPAIGAGEGMAEGGAGVGGVFLAAGVGAASPAAAPAPAPPPPPAPAFVGGGPGFAAGREDHEGGGVECPNCHSTNQAVARFCASCGTELPPPAVVCTNCDAENPAEARFCGRCGHRLEASPAVCPSCGTEAEAGARFCPSCGTPIGGHAGRVAGPQDTGSPPPNP